MFFVFFFAQQQLWIFNAVVDTKMLTSGQTCPKRDSKCCEVGRSLDLSAHQEANPKTSWDEG